MAVARRRVIPQWLWTLGESGTWLDFTPDHTFTDTAGTTPAGAGDFIANAGDRSPNGADAVQGTSPARAQLLQTGGGIYYASLDHTDDIFPVTLGAITGGTVALVGLNGIYYQESWDFAGGTLNIGPTSLPGLPAGILSVVGGLCAVLVLDRALTAAEKAAVSAWGKARGAAGVFELGPELVTNGDFSAGSTGWTLTGGWSIGSGVATHAASGTFDILDQTSLPTNEDDAYMVSMTVTASVSTISAVRFGGATAAENIAVNVGAGDFRSATQMQGPISRIRLLSNETYAGTVDNISIRKLELVP